MPFVTIPGLKGKVYVPQQAEGSVKKNPCKDCYSCQHCSDDRCGVCLAPHNCRRPSLELIDGTETTKRNS
jgi:hypothetical protein